jgi:phosphoesterase, MJ0936 family
MRVFVISDIHGSRSALESALAVFDREGADWIAVLGDYLNHGPRNPIPEGYDPQGAAALLNSRKERIVPIRGNCDSEVDQMLLEFPMLGEHATIILGKRRLFLAHGHLLSPERLPPLPAGSVFLSGHTHIPALERRGAIVTMNPGSIAIPKGGSARGYGIVDESTIAIKTLEGETIAELSLD